MMRQKSGARKVEPMRFGDQLSGTGTDHGRTERHKIFKLWKCYDSDAREHSYNDEQES